MGSRDFSVALAFSHCFPTLIVTVFILQAESAEGCVVQITTMQRDRKTEDELIKSLFNIIKIYSHANSFSVSW